MLTPAGELITPKALSSKLVEIREPIADGARPGETLREALDRVEAWMIRRALSNGEEAGHHLVYFRALTLPVERFDRAVDVASSQTELGDVGSTTMVGFDDSRVTFDASELRANWSGLSYVDGTQVKIDFTFTAVPEPGTALLLGVGLAGIALSGPRRSRMEA